MKKWNGDHLGRVYDSLALGILPSSNWTLTYCAAIKQGRLRVLQMQFTYGGTTITSGSSGNITDQALLAVTLPSDWIPASNVTFGFNCGGTSDGAGLLSTAGQVSLSSLSPNATIASGNAVVLTATYIV